MLEVEGGDHEWCMRILRHEAGHLVDNMFVLRRRRQRREVFGPSSEPYPEFYAPKPYSKSYVLHLDSWYAQSHPDEDFAETFAVWLTPGSDWARRYEGWPALRKLQYMDQLMGSIAGKPPRLVHASEVDGLSRVRRTLRQHYRRKRRHYGVDRPDFYDRDLRRLFSDAPEFCRQRDGRRVRHAHPPPGAAAGGQLDRHLPVHDRPGAGGHHRPVPGLETASRGARGHGPPRIHRAAHGAGHELPAQRRHRLAL